MIVVVGLVVGIAIGVVVIEKRGADSALIEVKVFDSSSSFCRGCAKQSFLAGIEGVADTEGTRSFQRSIATVRAGLLKRTAARRDTPSEIAPDLTELARQLLVGARSGDFGPALIKARAIDAFAKRRCT